MRLVGFKQKQTTKRTKTNCKLCCCYPPRINNNSLLGLIECTKSDALAQTDKLQSQKKNYMYLNNEITRLHTDMACCRSNGKTTTIIHGALYG